MNEHFIIYGSWALRHNEPLAAEHTVLRLHRLHHARPADHSLLLDLRGSDVPLATLSAANGLRWHENAPPVACANLSARELPLAVVRIEGEQVTITHLLTRVERHTSHLIHPHRPASSCLLVELAGALREAFQANHLYLNNFECYYVKGMPDTELEQKFNIDGEYDYHLVNRQWFTALAEGRIEGFALQLGDELEHWSYDNDFCRIAPNPDGIAGYVSIMHWSRKRKASWDEPVVTYKKKLYQEDALERWERNYPEQVLAGCATEALGQFFELPMAPLPRWRRTRYDIACESLVTGNIFMVNLEDSRIENVAAPAGRLQQCEIEYLKTRGTPDEATIYADIELLSKKVEVFLREAGLTVERTNYSKLTFLEDYVRGGSVSAMGEAA